MIFGSSSLLFKDPTLPCRIRFPCLARNLDGLCLSWILILLSLSDYLGQETAETEGVLSLVLINYTSFDDELTLFRPKSLLFSGPWFSYL